MRDVAQLPCSYLTVAMELSLQQMREQSIQRRREIEGKLDDIQRASAHDNSKDAEEIPQTAQAQHVEDASQGQIISHSEFICACLSPSAP
jgi:hypothetical protein